MKRIFTRFLAGIGLFAGLSYGVSAQNYCSSNSTSTFDSDITLVEISNISNNTTTQGCTGYTYFNNLTADLAIGSTYSMTVELGVNQGGGCGSDIYTKSARVFIDFNGDGDFDDQGEIVGETNYTGGTHSTTFDVDVPCTAVAGVSRMRVVCVENSPTNISACGTYTYGETEDYNVNLIAGSNPTAVFAVPDTVYTGRPVTFANGNQIGYTHQWFNEDADPTLNVVQSTNTNYNYTFNTAGCYNIKLISSNCQGSAITTRSICVVNPTSVPEANFVASENIVVFTGDPVRIQFYDLSLYGANQWEWTITPDMTNGAPWFWSIGNQYSQNPEAFFYDYGTYEVCLTATNALGSSNPECRTAYIVIAPPSGQNPENIMGIDTRGTLDSAYIYDSGGPLDNYSGNEFNTFVIEPCGASAVTLHFDEFDTENGNDRLEVFDGPNSSFPSLGSFTGTNLPNSVTANSGKMTLQFVSNNTNNSSGFKAYWTSDIPNNGPATGDFNMPDTIWECSGGTDLFIENASSGVVDGQASYDWIFDYDSTVTYTPGYCEACDEDNPAWKYSYVGSVQDYLVRMVMKTCEGNDTVVKKVILSPSSGLPTVDFSADNRRVSKGSTVTLTQNTEGGCSYNWIVAPASGWEFVNGTQADDAIVQVKFNNAGSYHVTLEVANDNGTQSEVKTNYIDVIDYCTPVVLLPTIADVGISRVMIENIDNATPTGRSSGYSNYKDDFSVELVSGQTYSITIERNSNVNSLNRKAWIDFNRDGTFQDPAERIVLETSNTNKSFTGTFTVPDYKSTLTGESRLRVSVAMGNGSNTPCGPVQVGEIEDYGVMLKHDDEIPVINLIGNDTVIMERHQSYNELGAIATDNIEGNISNRIQITNTVDSAQAGFYYVSYNVKDASGLSAVTVRRLVIVSSDITAPQISLMGNNPLVHPVLTPWSEPGYTATDAPSGSNITMNVNESNNLNVNVVGDYEVRYNVYDQNGNLGSETRVVQVRDLDAPTVDIDTQVFWQVGVPFTERAIVTDNYDANATLSRTGVVNVNVFGNYDVMYEAVDGAGNSSGMIPVRYVVGDSVKPTIQTVPATDNWTVQVNDVDYVEPDVEAFDNYFPNVQLDRDASAVDIYTLGTYPVIYTATDGAGNQATYTRMIRVVDTERPVIVANPLNLDRWSSFDPMQGVSVIDNYNEPAYFLDPQNDAIQIVLNQVDIDYPGVYQVVYRAVDESGNRSELKSRIVNVRDLTNGVDPVQMANAIEVYPNPNNGQFQLSIGNGVLDQNATIQIIDQLGNEVYSTNAHLVAQSKLDIDLGNVAAGVYMIKIAGQQGVVTKRIVVN